MYRQVGRVGFLIRRVDINHYLIRTAEDVPVVADSDIILSPQENEVGILQRKITEPGRYRAGPSHKKMV
jgi:hypothetical protein